MIEKEISHLLEVYKRREDLQSVFPEVEIGNFQAFINWAADVCSKKWSSEEYDFLKKFDLWYINHRKEISIFDRVKNIPQLEKILQVYFRRIELMSTIHVNDFQSLINWAAGVSDERWPDQDFEKIKMYKDWYLNREKPRNDQININQLEEIFNFTDSPMRFSLKTSIEKSEINEHQVTLFMLTVENNLKRTLELGVREGRSTMVLSEAINLIGGHLWSIDIADCPNVKKKMKEMGLEHVWSFIKNDDKEVAKTWDKELDHVFIDTSHTYDDTIEELRIFSKFVVKNGFITLHDIISYPEVLTAIKDFVKENPKKYRFYNYVNNNGLGILRKLY